MRTNIAWILLTLGLLTGSAICLWVFFASNDPQLLAAAGIVMLGLFGFGYMAVKQTTEKR